MCETAATNEEYGGKNRAAANDEEQGEPWNGEVREYGPLELLYGWSVEADEEGKAAGNRR
jgi:hypothetical protein